MKCPEIYIFFFPLPPTRKNMPDHPLSKQLNWCGLSKQKQKNFCFCFRVLLDSISSRFNVLNTPISTTVPIDAKTHVWPIDGIAQWLTNQRSLLGHIQARKWDVICVLSTVPITAPSFDETAGICAIVAVVDTRSLAGARNHCEGSVGFYMLY
jgi:hypothetical protein